MNRLSTKERAEIIRLLVEGNSLRSTSRITGRSINTVSKLLVDIGVACSEFQNRTLTNLDTRHVECDEIWAFVAAKEKNVPEEHRGEFGWGDVWTWVAIDQDSRLVVTWLVGTRGPEAAHEFTADLRSRVRGRVQITTDGYKPYLEAIRAAFGDDVDYAQLKKEYGADVNDRSEVPQARKYSPRKVTRQDVSIISGSPDPERISTSYVERNNLSMRMSVRRFTRLTNAFSKKVENHAAAIALYTMWQNFGRPHNSLAIPYPRTPAMAAGISDHAWTCEEIAALLD